jgi:hypothetical protein
MTETDRIITRRHLLSAFGAVGGIALCACWVCAASQRRLFHLPPDPNTELWPHLLAIGQDQPWETPRFAPAIERLDGSSVTLRGFMLTLVEAPQHATFVLTANPVGCPGCAPNRLGMRVHVSARRGLATTNQPMTLTGRLRLARFGGTLPYALHDTIAG